MEIAIVNQEEDVVKELLTLPNWRELMRNAQPIHYSEGYDTPMRKLIRYLPQVAIWMIENGIEQVNKFDKNYFFPRLVQKLFI